jgi:hypothetical protein
LSSLSKESDIDDERTVTDIEESDVEESDEEEPDEEESDEVSDDEEPDDEEPNEEELDEEEPYEEEPDEEEPDEEEPYEEEPDEEEPDEEEPDEEEPDEEESDDELVYDEEESAYVHKGKKRVISQNSEDNKISKADEISIDDACKLLLDLKSDGANDPLEPSHTHFTTLNKYDEDIELSHVQYMHIITDESLPLILDMESYLKYKDDKVYIECKVPGNAKNQIIPINNASSFFGTSRASLDLVLLDSVDKSIDKNVWKQLVLDRIVGDTKYISYEITKADAKKVNLCKKRF